jgi:fluoride ion exporter CrcB/FEX
MIELAVWPILALLFSALIAMLLRFWDIPTNTIQSIDIQTAIVTFVGALIAGFLTVWAANLDPTTWGGFLVTTIAAVGGMGGVRGIFEVSKRLSKRNVEVVEKKED